MWCVRKRPCTIITCRKICVEHIVAINEAWVSLCQYKERVKWEDGAERKKSGFRKIQNGFWRKRMLELVIKAREFLIMKSCPKKNGLDRKKQNQVMSAVFISSCPFALKKTIGGIACLTIDSLKQAVDNEIIQGTANQKYKAVEMLPGRWLQ